MAKKKYSRRKTKYSVNAGIMLVTVIVICFGVIMFFHINTLKEESKQYIALESELVEELAEEESREKELEESKAFIQTPEYIEKVAREKLGLIGSDEVVVRASE